jgi:hypothetical protein
MDNFRCRCQACPSARMFVPVELETDYDKITGMYLTGDCLLFIRSVVDVFGRIFTLWMLIKVSSTEDLRSSERRTVMWYVLFLLY